MNYGPENPHPFSKLKTELVWEGKYNEYGRRREVTLPQFPLVMQKIETVDEPRDRSRAQGSLFDEGTAHQDDFRNRLIWGDNKLSLATLLSDFRGMVDLIYIDPPFDVGANFKMDVPVGDGGGLEKDQSAMEAVAFSDMWGSDGGAYPNFIYERLALARDLLKPTGNIFVHCDWRVDFILRAILEDLFPTTYRNQIVWYYYNKFQGNVGQFAANHDTLLFYSKSNDFYFQPIKEARDSKVKQLKRAWDKEKGAIVNAKDEHGRVIYIDSTEKTIDDVWRLSMLQPADKTENLGYATQKPEALLRRVIESSCPEGGLVLDFFCGSGTTLAAAEKLGRKWIGCDLGRYAIHTARKRLIGIQRDLHAESKQYRSFDLYNLGRYERQWWQFDRLKGANEEHRATVLKFFRAQPLAGSPSSLLHGTKGGAFVHVDDIDSLLTLEELEAVVKAASDAGGKAVQCLAWEFQMDLKMKAQALEAKYDIKIGLKYIPREIMEPNRTEVQFFEAAALSAESVVTVNGKEKTVDVKLTSFIPSLSEVPEKELEALRERAVKSPFDFIDFWAIDFEHREDKPFEHHWQDYRTRKDRKLLTESNCRWKYAAPGKKLIRIKVIDVFGIDTTKVIEVTI